MALFILERIEGTKAKFTYLTSEFDRQAYILNQEHSFVFTSTRPVVKKTSGEFHFTEIVHSLKEVIQSSQNDYAGFQFENGVDDFKVTASSARFTRARIYYIVQDEKIIFSNSLKELTPFSERKMNAPAAFSILKYGETPEYVNFISDIFSIPASSYLTLDKNKFNAILSSGIIDLENFVNFFQISFQGDGGNIPNTARKLDSLFSLLGSTPVIVPISGGVDSTVINHLINKHSSNAYPGFFLQFGPQDTEVEFAKKAAKDTKAELEICQMNPSDFQAAFEFQIDKLNQPLGESSAIAMAHFFRSTSISDRFVIDGTLADGTYGSTNYNKDLWTNQREKSLFEQRAAEYVLAFIQSNNLKSLDRFFPRDSLQKDVYVRFLHQYLGPFANTWFAKAASYTDKMGPYWSLYYDMIAPVSKNDDWAKYTIFKMVNYACKNNTAKPFDLSRPKNNAFYPFTWKEVLEDQAHYSWKEKTTDNIVKYPLQKILENYLGKDFIYRKKMGLNSSFEDWISTASNKNYLVALLERPGGITDFMIGAKKKRLIAIYKSGKIHPNLSRLVINLAIQQAWIEKHGILL
ncbi:MAG: hypothetical protein JWO06_1078 [Bacteroidota bacterium]|nr:hypothetical protein [Bacteroidota bacterium]